MHRPCLFRTAFPVVPNSLSQRSAPVFFVVAPGRPVFLSLAHAREWSAGWRNQWSSARGADVPLRQARFATRRSIAAFLSPGPCFRARTEGLAANGIQAAFAALHPRHVQPLKAAPRSWSGRRPGASRRRGCEPRPRAPHPAPPVMTPHESALWRTERIGL